MGRFVGADSAVLFPGRTFTASVTGLSGTYNLGTHAFGLTLTHFTLTVGSAFTASADGVAITYDPENSDPAQQLVEIDAGSIVLPQLGISGAVENLHIRKNGFSFRSPPKPRARSTPIEGALQ